MKPTPTCRRHTSNAPQPLYIWPATGHFVADSRQLMAVDISTVTLHKIGATTRGPRARWRSRKLLVLLQHFFLPCDPRELLHLFELLSGRFHCGSAAYYGRPDCAPGYCGTIIAGAPMLAPRARKPVKNLAVAGRCLGRLLILFEIFAPCRLSTAPVRTYARRLIPARNSQ